MKFLSFDIGIRNLAYCIVNDKLIIEDWDIINIVDIVNIIRHKICISQV